MAKTFKETIASIRAAMLGIEVRECIAQGMEYVEQFASTAVDKAAEAVKAASEALASKNAAASSATAAKTSQTAAASSASAAKTSETNSAASAKNAKDSETKSAEHLQATKDYFEQVRTITIGAQGWYATGDDLKAAVSTGEDGWWAVVGTTDSIWVWDSDTAAWKDSMVPVDLSDYYTRSQVDTKLSAKAESIVLATNANLNNVTTPGIYSCGGGKLYHE